MASKPYQHLVAAEPPEHQKKLLWMASLVVAAERASAGDPNKRSLLVMKLSGAEALALDLLKARLSLSSRQAVVRNCLAYRLKSIR